MLHWSPRLHLTDEAACEWGQPASFVANHGRAPNSYHPSHRVDKAFLGTTTILTDDWTCQPALSPVFYTHFKHDPWDSSLVHMISPWALAAHTSVGVDSLAYSPNTWQTLGNHTNLSILLMLVLTGPTWPNQWLE